ncbi:MAG: hypothetical protein V1810_02765 [Candidatus Beckwithbacteria bacterium]
MKKVLYLLLIFVFTISLSGCKKKASPTVQTPTRPVETINQLAVADRPFVTLTPRSDGKEVVLGIDAVKNAATVEYELEYQAESLIQGVFGTIDFAKEPTPVAKNLLFGSCSKGKCKYDEGVSGGSLTLRFEGGDQPYVLKSDFNLQNMFDRQGIFTSKDIKATLDVGKTGLASGTYVIIASTMGLPQAVTSQIIAGPYAFLAASSPVLSNATISIKSKEDLTEAKLLFWTGKVWQELTATIADGKISAPAAAFGTFIVVK